MIKIKFLNKIKAFTLLEMLMTLAIFGIITSVVMFNYGDFNSDIVLSNTAYEIALQVREAQVYSLGVRNNPTLGVGGAASYDSNYGVYITKGKSFIFFADKADGTPNFCDGASSGDCTACESGGECKNVISILRGISVTGICGSNSVTIFNETTGACLGSSIEAATITFKRPDPDAKIFKIVGDTVADDYKNIGITISAPNGNKKAVIIRSTGQISVENIK